MLELFQIFIHAQVMKDHYKTTFQEFIIIWDIDSEKYSIKDCIIRDEIHEKGNNTKYANSILDYLIDVQKNKRVYILDNMLFVELQFSLSELNSPVNPISLKLSQM